ncbi:MULTISPECIES: hypothetical protein [unclassified Pseudoalteromonas]|uniref:hypothetical protein n=1 Tax=unclassified Pseudoalteromonas TaxID=194690 RepID=UPI002097F4F5|nr:hypothetical protein [Pseudoalteromonas sp. XMcav2-N]MCO7189197.1 hypothetical protein [Pseudoalteromonas sp. XMcav2-N]
MKLQIKKKNMKVLSNLSNLDAQATPNVAGGTIETRPVSCRYWCGNRQSDFNCNTEPGRHCVTD